MHVPTRMDSYTAFLPSLSVSADFSFQKGANLCLKCTKIRLLAGLCPDPLGELKRSPRPSSRNQEVLTAPAGKSPFADLAPPKI